MSYISVGRFKTWGFNSPYNGGGKGDSPDPPDYRAAAIETAKGNAEAARIAAKANRVSQYTPYGNLIYTQGTSFDEAAYNKALEKYNQDLSAYNSAGGVSSEFTASVDPWSGNIVTDGSSVSRLPKPNAPNRQDYVTGDPDVWKATVELSPDQQKLLEQQNKVSLGLADLSNQGLSYVKDMLSKPFDTSKLPAEQILAGQTAQDAIMARLDPKFAQNEEALRARLANQGIAQGTQAWENEMRGFQQGRNDAYLQAALQGMGFGQQARQQAIQEQAFFRNEPLNTLNAVRSGAQVTNPTFTNVPQQQTTAGPDFMGAAQQNYNAQLQNYNAEQAAGNNMMGGLFSLGASFMGSPWGGAASKGLFGSDRSIKQNIKHLGKNQDGLNIYKFEYKDEFKPVWGSGEFIGFMADEVKKIYPEAVVKHHDGYDMVDYGRINYA